MFIFAESMWATIGSGVAQALLPVLSTILVAALVGLIKKGIDKLGVKRSQEIDTMLDKYVGIGIGHAERFALNRLSADGKSSVTGKDKLGLAVSTVMSELDQSGITGVVESLIVGRIEHALGDDSKKELTS